MELLVLGLVAGIGFASYALWHKARKDEGHALTAERKRLMAPAPNARRHVIRGRRRTAPRLRLPRRRRVTFSEDGRGARLYRLFDDGGERFLYAKAGGTDPLLLAPTTLVVEGEPPENIQHAGGAYRQTARAQASAIRVGQLGARKHGDRVRIFEYAGPGPARLLVVDWGDKLEAFAGERVLGSALEILPAR